MFHLRLCAAVVGIGLWAVAACGSSEPDATLPFDAVLLEVFDTTDLDAWRHEADGVARSVAIDCMAESGWEYQLPPQEPAPPNQDELDDRDFREREGFGIVSTFVARVRSGSQQGDEDLNRAYLSTLTAAEIRSYLLDLQGPPAEPGQLQSDTGCLGRAAETAYGASDRFFSVLTNFGGLAEERDTHPDWLDARALWRECMLESGFDYFEPEEIRSDVRAALNDAVLEVYPNGRLPLVASGDGFDIDPSIEPLLDELQALEIDAALTDADCTAPLADRFEVVEREVQQGYVDRNRDAIDMLIDELG